MVSENQFGELIHSYSRKQAIEDGVLVDLTQFQITRQSFRYPVACTDTVWAIIQDAVDNHGHDYIGTLHDIYCLAKLAIRKGQYTEVVLFQVSIALKAHMLKLHIGPGDCAEPVLTLMLPNED